ncbi:phage baseplate assembly protein V [Paenibacillus agilis]|uniref:phage baseplate assembly protein V n=1 Tax=Paenibacillus agilis TaxID=3020863 RepID=UPI003AB5BDB1
MLDVAKDTVKVHLEVDKQQSVVEASWFSYASLYTAEGNSGCYCMPEKGDSVMLYFPDGEEKNATAMSSVRKGYKLRLLKWKGLRKILSPMHRCQSWMVCNWHSTWSG